MAEIEVRKSVFLSLTEAVNASGLSIATLRRAIRRGTLAAYRPGGGRRVLIDARDLDGFMRGTPVRQGGRP